MGVDVSHDDFVITEVKKKFRDWCEIGGRVGYRGDVNLKNVYCDIVDGGCNGEILGEKGVGGMRNCGWSDERG